MLQNRTMRMLLRTASWVCLGLITILSLLPHQIEAGARTALPGQIEHVIAYAGTATLFALAYPNGSRWLIVAGLAGYGGFLEVAQNLVPDRSPELIGALANALGALLGTVAGAAVVRWTSNGHPPQRQANSASRQASSIGRSRPQARS